MPHTPHRITAARRQSVRPRTCGHSSTQRESTWTGRDRIAPASRALGIPEAARQEAKAGGREGDVPADEGAPSSIQWGRCELQTWSSHFCKWGIMHNRRLSTPSANLDVFAW